MKANGEYQPEEDLSEPIENQLQASQTEATATGADQNDVQPSTHPEPAATPSNRSAPSPPAPFEHYQNPYPRSAQGKPRYFKLYAAPSQVNHREYIERQPHYGSYVPETSMAQEDLRKSVPMVGLSEATLVRRNAPSIPQRIILKDAKRLAEKKTLRQMWEEAQGRAGMHRTEAREVPREETVVKNEAKRSSGPADSAAWGSLWGKKE